MDKRFFDFAGALVLLALTLPCILVVAVWIKMTSPGPAIFCQKRLGYRGVPFTIFKFRTMVNGSGHSGETILPGDDRVTVPGRFLRKTHLDELPQLFNVLLGQMSLVGPRPLSVALAERFVRECPEFKGRLDGRPGLTGLVQIRGKMWAVNRGPRAMLRLERFYIAHQNVWLDVKVLFKTIGSVIRADGV